MSVLVCRVMISVIAVAGAYRFIIHLDSFISLIEMAEEFYES
jgi:hypothetical protein